MPDIKFIIYYINKNSFDEIYDKDDFKSNNNYLIHSKNLRSSKNVFKQKVNSKMSKYYLTKVGEKETSNNNINNNRNLEVEKRIKKNTIKIEIFMKKYLTNEEMITFE